MNEKNSIGQYSLLINTCDKFEDCWDPFFKLFSIYWPDFSGKIYLNTEYKNYSYKGLNIVAIKGCKLNSVPRNKRATWSECLKWALQNIDSNIVLYMQEDYFLKKKVDNKIVEEYVQLMKDNDDLHCVHLTDQAVESIDTPTNYSGLKKVLLKQRYRISCQSALWKKDVLMDHIRTYENAWQFEEFGSKRSALKNDNFYVVDENWVQLDKFEIIPYIFTGIVQGRWYNKVVPLFEKHDIKVDYSIRGFLENSPKRTFKKKLQHALSNYPTTLRSMFEIYCLKLLNHSDDI